MVVRWLGCSLRYGYISSSSGSGSGASSSTVFWLINDVFIHKNTLYAGGNIRIYIHI